MKIPIHYWRRAAVLVAIAAVLVVSIRAALQPTLRRRLIKRYTPEYKPPSASPPAGGLGWVEVAHGFRQPTDLEFVPGASGLAVVLEKAGTARLVDLANAGRPSPESVAPLETVLDLTVR